MTSHLANYPNQPASYEEMLDSLQRDAFGYFLHENNPANGLVVDKTQAGAPASIAAVGFALAVYPVGVERSWMTRPVDATTAPLAVDAGANVLMAGSSIFRDREGVAAAMNRLQAGIGQMRKELRRSAQDVELYRD